MNLLIALQSIIGKAATEVKLTREEPATAFDSIASARAPSRWWDYR